LIAVLDYGIGNLASAQKALAAVGVPSKLASESADVMGADGIVLPGVGAFGRCMDALRDCRLDSAVYRSIDAGIPFLGICVGFQMLYEDSEESPGVEGLGILKGSVRRLSNTQKLPQMQWNRLELTCDERNGLFSGCGERPWMYFVHSYAPVPEEQSTEIATCDYGGTVVAAVSRGNVAAVQFHPEKSGRSGLRLLKNFADQCTRNSRAASNNG